MDAGFTTIRPRGTTRSAALHVATGDLERHPPTEMFTNGATRPTNECSVRLEGGAVFSYRARSRERLRKVLRNVTERNGDRVGSMRESRHFGSWRLGCVRRAGRAVLAYSSTRPADRSTRCVTGELGTMQGLGPSRPTPITPAPGARLQHVRYTGLDAYRPTRCGGHTIAPRGRDARTGRGTSPFELPSGESAARAYIFIESLTATLRDVGVPAAEPTGPPPRRRPRSRGQYASTTERKPTASTSPPTTVPRSSPGRRRRRELARAPPAKPARAAHVWRPRLCRARRRSRPGVDKATGPARDHRRPAPEVTSTSRSSTTTGVTLGRVARATMESVDLLNGGQENRNRTRVPGYDAALPPRGGTRGARRKTADTLDGRNRRPGRHRTRLL